MLANLGAALHEMFVHTGRTTLLDDAIAVQDELIRPPHPRPPERTLNLGVSLLARFRRRDRADLDRGLELFQEAATAGGSQVERASALNSQANALSLRFDLSPEDGPGSRADIERCVDLREQAVATTAPGSLDGALYRGNLGVDLLKRFELPTDERDLLRAVDKQRRAVENVPPRSAEQPVLLAGLADSLARLAARAELDTVIEEIPAVDGFTQFLAPPTFDDVTGIATTPLVYLAPPSSAGSRWSSVPTTSRGYRSTRSPRNAVRSRVETHLTRLHRPGTR